MLGRPSIVELISSDLLLELEGVNALVSRADDEYKSFLIDGRRIDAPKLDLKYVQSWVLDFVRAETPKLPSHVMAYEPGCNIVANAEAHRRNAHILCMDIKSFFYSCSVQKVRLFFSGLNFGLSSEDIDALVALTTHSGSLPMGSPCSPAIANRIMLPVDAKIISALGASCVYTRYADDITVSSVNRIESGTVVKAVSEILDWYGFTLNQKKTRCMGRGDARRVTGVYIEPDGSLSIGSKRKRRLNGMIYSFLVHGVGSASEILGMLNFARLIDPCYVSDLILKYASYGAAREYGGLISALKHAVDT